MNRSTLSLFEDVRSVTLAWTAIFRIVEGITCLQLRETLI